MQRLKKPQNKSTTFPKIVNKFSRRIRTLGYKTCLFHYRFPNLCIQHVTRRKASEVIEYRILESMKLDKQVKLGNLNMQTDLSGNPTPPHHHPTLSDQPVR